MERHNHLPVLERYWISSVAPYIYFDRVKVFLLQWYVNWLVVYHMYSVAALARYLNDAKQRSLRIAYRNMFQDITIHIHGGEATIYIASLCRYPLYNVVGCISYRMSSVRYAQHLAHGQSERYARFAPFLCLEPIRF